MPFFFIFLSFFGNLAQLIYFLNKNLFFFRNELGIEPIRKIAITKTNTLFSQKTTTKTRKNLCLDDDIETWHREHTAAEIGVLEDVSNVYLGGRLCKFSIYII